jgi:hypothetical protein
LRVILRGTFLAAALAPPLAVQGQGNFRKRPLNLVRPLFMPPLSQGSALLRNDAIIAFYGLKEQIPE